MKCPNCTQEVNLQRFCIYCGFRLKDAKNPSHVFVAPKHISQHIKMRQRRSLSQSDLPVPKARVGMPALKLLSLESLREKSGSGAQIDTSSEEMHDGEWMMSRQRNDKRQSKELEELLQKLNGGLSLPESVDYVDDDDSLEIHIDESIELQRDASIGASLEADFFLHDNEPSFDLDMASESLPMASGAFTRTASGGFKLVWESVKDVAATGMERIKSLWKPKQNQRQTAAKRDLRPYAIAAIVLCSTILLIVALLSLDSEGEQSGEEMLVAAAAGVQTEQNSAIEQENTEFQLIRLDDSAALGAPDLANADMMDFGEEANVEANEAVAVVEKNSAHERRVFGTKDNVLASAETPKTVKLKRNCVMREGPASRFKLVKEVKAKEQIKVLSTSQEDWVLQEHKGSLVWTKDCLACKAKLGPGMQFADALEGQKVPAPLKGRVISSNNWAYVLAGKDYGYIGPACFK
ncbi:MAG: SH3 domain-containing protein [Bradymonadales bacterium]|jgi:hypothetical protein